MCQKDNLLEDTKNYTTSGGGIMGGLFDMFAGGEEKKETMENEKVIENEKTVENAKLLLREEELDIAKDRVQTGEVILGKEVIEEQKTVNVPVTHEEVIIERRAINENSDEPIGTEETIHIPVSEERVEVGKHTIVTGEVSAHKREIEETRHIDETIRREEARVTTEGHPNVVSNETLDERH